VDRRTSRLVAYLGLAAIVVVAAVVGVLTAVQG